MEGGPETGGVSECLWREGSNDAYASLHHPFVQALAQNKLPKATFEYFLGQDSTYLRAFAKAYGLLLAQPELDAEAVSCVRDLLQGVHNELAHLSDLAKGWETNPNQEPNEACRAYTNFLLDTAVHEDAACILAAMMPCMRLYSFLGCQLAAAYPRSHSDWVRIYAGPAFNALPRRQEQLLDRLGPAAPFGKLRRLYKTALRLEVAFFEAQHVSAATTRIGMLVTDFDDTCTASDTIATILQTATDAKVKAAEASGRGAGQVVRTSMQQLQEQLVAGYIQQRDALISSVIPEDVPPREEFDMRWVAEFVDKLSAFDCEMNVPVIESEILEGMAQGDLTQAGEKVALQPGCLQTLMHAKRRGLPVHVISVNWSEELVRAALSLPPTTASASRDAESEVTLGAGEISVHANELAYSGDTSTGGILRRVQSGADKSRVLDDLLLSKAIEDGTQGLTVYIGDSASDISPLLAADIGIIIGQNKLLRRVAVAAGITIKPLAAAPRQERSKEGTLYSAACWQEIEAFLFGPEDAPLVAAPGASPAHSSIKVPRVLTIAGSDSGGGAGIQADLKTYLACGVFGASAVTALTSQNTHGVHGVRPVAADFLEQQIDDVLSDIGADVVKTGMLPSGEAVEVVAKQVQAHNVRALVVDPVLVSTSGHSLAERNVGAALIKHLFPLATVITPNVPEASGLLGGKKVDSLETMKEAATELHRMGPQFVLVKGGHLIDEAKSEDVTSSGRKAAVDVLYDGKEIEVIELEKVRTNNTHGTGCTLASAIAAYLAKGLAPSLAIRQAKAYLTQALAASADLAIGSGVQQPMNHGYAMNDWGHGWLQSSARARGIGPAMDLRVYGVTDPSCNAKQGRSNAEAVRAAIAGGMTLVQLREKDADGGDFCREARAVLQVARPKGVPVLINDRLDVALITGADGVHVGQDDLPAASVRRMLTPGMMLGVSVKTVKQAQQAQADGADYLGAGAVFSTPTKDSSVIGLEGLRAICAAVTIPVVAIGGIKAENVQQCIEAGAAGAAVVSGIFGMSDPAAASSELRRQVDSGLARRGATGNEP
ncbi:hypothetical protein WJX74_010080 [Apatococcus lobatus]|uniref:thiamine phosphate synthase n=1 Tax=Apatococcus lobatus TaxID=904363 RepID=A0AAW1RKY3_9CHLO